MGTGAALVSALRGGPWGFVTRVWNEVEDAFHDLPEEMRREKATEYGLVYVFRKNELNSANLFQSSRIGGTG